ncbi:MAG: arginine--tRNA ligase [Eubacteriales bacterium]|nr:arginine--tRNA ligase [Eubacteriales bacterium]
MNKIIDILNSKAAAAFEAAGYDPSAGKVNVSNRPDLCEYQCNGAMALAKKEHKKPIDIANAVAAILKEDPAFAKAESCMPGFINMDLSGSFLAEYIYGMQESETAGLIKSDDPKKIMVDYGGANVAKPLHVGHLRSAVIGEALKRIGAALGNEMTGDVHLGDWGLQMGLIIEELKDRGQTEFTLSDLEEIYPAASKKSKETDDDGKPTEAAAEFKARALNATAALQSGDSECIEIWKRIMELSVADLKKNYDDLDVHFELWKGESDVQKYIPDMLQSFIDKGIAYESQGALVVDVQEETDTKELPPCIVRKSDGSALYATTDLATLVERELLYKPDAYVYVADQRQSLHYQSFFRVARKAGIVRPEETLDFLGFGTMNGKDGKPFKTRSGGVMRLEVLISDICDSVYEKIRATRDESEISEAEAREISKIVGLAALKYGDLSNQAAKDYVFDIDRFTSFEGNTGPYILYTIVRIGSILKRCSEAERNAVVTKDVILKAIDGSADVRDLAIVLSRYNEIIPAAWEQLAPHKICQFIYELANAFNTFYHNVKILTEEDAEKKAGYIAMLKLTKRVLEDCIHMLGFSAPEKM